MDVKKQIKEMINEEVFATLLIVFIILDIYLFIGL